MSLTIPNGQEPARNSLPLAGSWYPGAPSVGTQLYGLNVPNPVPGAQGTKFTEYAYEDYATSAFAPVVTALNFVPCESLHVPVPTGDPDYNTWRRISSTFDQYGALKQDGVIATKGELIWVYKGSVPKPKSSLEDERKAFYTPHTYDYTAENTFGITLPQLNRYFRHLSNPDVIGVLPNHWDAADLYDFAAHLDFMGVVDSVGPGQSMRTDRVRKNYVCVASRLAHGVADIWHANTQRPAAGGGLMLGGHAHLRTSHHRPTAMLYVVLTARTFNLPPLVGTFADQIRMEPAVAMSHLDLLRTFNRQVGGRNVIYTWFIGTYRSPNGNGTSLPASNVTEYVNGNSELQRGVPQCEISVDC